MTEYFVCSNLSHDGKAYEPGDSIQLDADSAAAVSLLEAGVIQVEAVESPTPVQEVETPEQSNPEVTVGGEPTVTGEPSIDGRDAPQGRVEAKDVTPEVDTSPTPVQEVETPEPGHPGSVSGGSKAPEEADPSANL